MMDELDRKILELLSLNGRLPVRRIAEVVHLSPQAITVRTDKLEKQGIIEGYRAIVNPEKIGNLIQAIVTMAIKPQLQADFIEFAKEQACVTECHHVTGAFSMIIMVSLPTITHLDDFVRKAQKYGNTQTLLVLSSPIKHRYKNQS